MRKEIIVKTQKEFDAIKKNFEGTIYIEGGTQYDRIVVTENFDEASIVVRGEAYAELWGSSHAVLWESSHAVLWESSHAVLRESSHAELRGSSHAELWESSHAVLWESSHAELRESSHAVLWGSSHAELRGSSHAVLWESSHAVLWESSHAELWESSHAVLWGSSHAELWGSSHAVLRGSSHAELWESSHAVLWGSSHAELWGSSHAVLWGSSHAVLRESSLVKLYGEAMVSAISAKEIICNGYNVVSLRKANKKNVNIVCNKNSYVKIVPDFKPDFKTYSEWYPVEIKGKKAILYKAVHKNGDKYFSQYQNSFTYKIGEVREEKCAPKSEGSCSRGLHISHKSWALGFGSGWQDMALLECEVEIKDIVVSADTDGKIRCSKLKVLREVPPNEYY